MGEAGTEVRACSYLNTRANLFHKIERNTFHNMCICMTLKLYAGERGLYKQVEMSDLSAAIESGVLTAEGDDELDQSEGEGN